MLVSLFSQYLNISLFKHEDASIFTICSQGDFVQIWEYSVTRDKRKQKSDNFQEVTRVIRPINDYTHHQDN